jgi:hypothetical protein
MRTKLILFVSATCLASVAHAGSQSSNTSSNSSSNNGVVRERIIDRYCVDGYCERSVSRRYYRDDRSYGRERARSYRHRYDDRRHRDDDDDDDD